MILCTDLDGTLHDHSQPEVLKTNLSTLETWKTAGHHACLITGRNHSVLPEIIPHWQNYFDFVATDNSGAIFNQNDKFVIQYPFPETVLKAIISVIPKDVLPVFYYPDKYTAIPIPKQLVIKLRLWFYELDELNFWHQLFTSNYKYVKSLPWPKPGYSPLPGIDLTKYCGFIDLVPKHGGKEQAVRYFAKVFKTTSIITVGDDHNDINMLNLHGFEGYAMKGSPLEVIRAASGHTVGSVSELISIKMSQT